MFQIIGKMYTGQCAQLCERIPETMEEWIDMQMIYATALGDHFSLAIMDLDGFGGFNSEFGHAAGDRMLRFVEDSLEQKLHSPNLVARSGDDEFGLILPGAKRQIAIAACRQLQIELAREGSLKLSVGCTTFDGNLAKGEVLVLEARLAMWRSRAMGGDCVTHFDDLLERAS